MYNLEAYNKIVDSTTTKLLVIALNIPFFNFVAIVQKLKAVNTEEAELKHNEITNKFLV